MTVISPSKWADPELVAKLESDPPESVRDALLATRILKVRATDLQTVKVGTVAKKRLRVVVLTDANVPVESALVTFSRVPSAKPGFAKPTPTALSGLLSDLGVGEPETVIAAIEERADEITVETNRSGFAEIYVTPDPVVLRNFVAPGKDPTQAQLYGFNEIAARVVRPDGGTIRLGSPIIVLGEPDVAARIAAEGPNFP